jgi:hypothetical protein
MARWGEGRERLRDSKARKLAEIRRTKFEIPHRAAQCRFMLVASPRLDR